MIIITSARLRREFTSKNHFHSLQSIFRFDLFDLELILNEFLKFV